MFLKDSKGNNLENSEILQYLSSGCFGSAGYIGLNEFLENKDEHCITQKDTQPNQTCSGGPINAQLFAIC